MPMTPTEKDAAVTRLNAAPLLGREPRGHASVRRRRPGTASLAAAGSGSRSGLGRLGRLGSGLNRRLAREREEPRRRLELVDIRARRLRIRAATPARCSPLA